MLIGTVEYRPYRIDNIGAVGVNDQVRVFIVVTGNMRIANALCRQLFQESDGIITMVDRVDIDIVDVQQKTAVGLAEHGIEKIDFLHFTARRRGVIGGVFHGDFLLQNVLYPADAFGHIMHGILGERDGQQVIEVAVIGAVAQVLAVMFDTMLLHEFSDRPDKVFIQRCRTADGQGQAVADEIIALGKVTKLFAESATDIDPVFRRDFHKVYRCQCMAAVSLQHFIELFTPQAKTGAVDGEGFAHIGTHGFIGLRRSGRWRHIFG